MLRALAVTSKKLRMRSPRHEFSSSFSYFLSISSLLRYNHCRDLIELYASHLSQSADAEGRHD